ncbi:hypothetical protein CKF48_23185 (plasmid) [Cytobacillus kochii]|uniref:Uncharacterized protein n=1 Tax=Cytobacillus kochii TaxID=859143 RepID=A0A248TPP8_9BACI|nr:hypothetical protein CKF48_23185 [Cytobacillus kochii]
MDSQNTNTDQEWAMVTRLISEEIYKDNELITGVGYSVSGKKMSYMSIQKLMAQKLSLLIMLLK